MRNHEVSRRTTEWEIGIFLRLPLDAHLVFKQRAVTQRKPPVSQICAPVGWVKGPFRTFSKYQVNTHLSPRSYLFHVSANKVELTDKEDFPSHITERYIHKIFLSNLREKGNKFLNPRLKNFLTVTFSGALTG